MTDGSTQNNRRALINIWSPLNVFLLYFWWAGLGLMVVIGQRAYDDAGTGYAIRYHRNAPPT